MIPTSALYKNEVSHIYKKNKIKIVKKQYLYVSNSTKCFPCFLGYGAYSDCIPGTW